MNPLEAYLAVYRIRRVELEISERYHPDEGDAPMRTPTHLSVGSEHVAVAVADAVPPGSHAYSTHRSHAHYLAWGGDLTAMVAELHGRSTGCADGWGGSMHLIDEAAGFMGTSAIVGSSVSLAVGDAFARQLESEAWAQVGGTVLIPDPPTLSPERDAVTVAFAGDAVPETGQFWEALNFAALKQLRLIIVIENNGLATSTILDDRQSFHHGPMAALQEAEDDRYSFLDFPTYAETASEVERLIAQDVWPIVISADVERFAEHVGPAIDDRIGTVDDQFEAMQRAALTFAASPFGEAYAAMIGDTTATIKQEVARVFDEMTDFEKHPWAKGMNE